MMKKKYAYQVGGIATATRESARIIQRSYRDTGANPVPRILQKITLERVVR
jgi:hypothetical protein